MTHTKKGYAHYSFADTLKLTWPGRDSGIGDHGLAGQQKYIGDHKCTDICDSLQLEDPEDDESNLKAAHQPDEDKGDTGDDL